MGARSLRGSTGIVLYRWGLIVIMLSASRARVYPSGTDLARRSMAILPLEPGRFSTTTGCPTSSASLCPTTRAEMSGAPPGGMGTISLIGRDGYWLHEAVETRAAKAIATKRLAFILTGPPAGATMLMIYDGHPESETRAPKCRRRGAMIFAASGKHHVHRTPYRTLGGEAQGVCGDSAPPRAVERSRLRPRERAQGKNRRHQPFGAAVPRLARPDEAGPGLRRRLPARRGADPRGLPGRGEPRAGGRLAREPRLAPILAPRPEARPGRHSVPLRRLERFLFALARPEHGVLLRLFPQRVRLPGARAGAEARSHPQQADARARGAVSGHRLRLGRSHHARGEEIRGSRDGRDAQPEPARIRHTADPRGGPGGPLRGAPPGLPRHSGGRRLRQDRERRHVRARRAAPSQGVFRKSPLAARGKWAGHEPRHYRERPRQQLGRPGCG